MRRLIVISLLTLGLAACNGSHATPLPSSTPVPSSTIAPTPDICVSLRANLAAAQTETAAKVLTLQLYERGCLIGPTPGP